MLEDIAQQAKAVASSIVSVSSHAKIKSVGVPQILDIEWERDAVEQPNWRMRMSAILEAERFRCRSSYHGRRSASRS
mgnify:FL=1